MSTDSLTLLPRLATQINEHHHQAETAMQAGLEHALEAGRLLTEAKAQCPHGTWADWLAENCEFSDRTARAYMQVAKRWPEIAAKRQTSADLSIDGALKMLAGPSQECLPKPPMQDEVEIPDLDPGLILFAAGRDETESMEIRPSIKYPGYYRVAHYRDLDTDEAEVIYDGKPCKYDRDRLAHALARHGFEPDTDWVSCPHDGQEMPPGCEGPGKPGRVRVP